MTDASEASGERAAKRGAGRKGRAGAASASEHADAPQGSGRVVHLRIRRQDAPDRPETGRWEEFKVAYLPRMNVISALQQIQKDPRTADGQEVAPVVWEAVCLEEVCGACTMVVNGRVRQACSTLVDALAPKGEVITIEPMSKFPLVRDLIVDRGRMFEDMKRVHAWIDIDGTHEIGPGPRESPEAQQERYPLSRCMTCGCCVEACPQYGPSNDFVGAFAISLVRLYNLHPTGKLQKTARLESVMGEGGVTDCGKSQNCVEVCPKEIPLVDSIASVSRDATKHLLFGWLLK
ncbi:succinate dehydrogenase iron-sulfur subunit [Chondromyces crocatus]|uniref:succinate dehydrogenase n=1 Tax=Chondromyces crocatus TaxID=52 RepID=A0A0K1E6T1_CHOCO|nr:succinate dehydrogenase iron-sulfur subunit [Chondromyces crocatus]AKT36288.1 succinate dehydrogenase iron-sulfur subunit [Chondromyces crocatus]